MAAAAAWVVAGAALAAAGAQGAAPVVYSDEGFSVSVTPFVEGGLNKIKAELLLDSNVLKCGGGTENCGYIAVGFGRSNSMAGSKVVACYTSFSTASPQQLCPTSQSGAPLCTTQSNSLEASFSNAGNVVECNITINSSVGGTDFTQGTINVLYAIGTGNAPNLMAFHDYKGNTLTFTNAGPPTPPTATPTSATPTTATPTTSGSQPTQTPTTRTPSKPNHASGLSASVMLGFVTALLGLMR